MKKRWAALYASESADNGTHSTDKLSSTLEPRTLQNKQFNNNNHNNSNNNNDSASNRKSNAWIGANFEDKNNNDDSADIGCEKGQLDDLPDEPNRLYIHEPEDDSCNDQDEHLLSCDDTVTVKSEDSDLVTSDSFDSSYLRQDTDYFN